MQRLVYRYVRRRRDLIAEAPQRSDRVEAMSLSAVARLRPGQSAIQTIVVSSDAGSVRELAAAIETRKARVPGLAVLALYEDTDARREENMIARKPGVVVSTPTRLIDHIRRDHIDLTGVSAVVIDVPAEGTIEQFSADLHFIYAKLERRPTTAVIVSDLGKEFDLLEDLLRRPVTLSDSAWTAPAPVLSTSRNEEPAMSELPFDPEHIKNKIKEIIHAVHHDEDPVELTQYRKYVRKYTSIFNRGYVLAYLLKQSLEGGSGKPSRSRRKGGTTPDSGKQSIFVSIGRSKRVRSRDLITFFTSADGITQDDIGQVKVLDNYSFVEISSDKAQAAIDELNGKELRGRKLTVNYARRK